MTTHDARNTPTLEDASRTWAALVALREEMVALDPSRFLRGTTAWIRDGFIAPLARLVDDVRTTLGTLDDVIGGENEIGGLCFAGRAETGEARRALSNIELEREELLIAAESARERVVQVLDALLALDGHSPALAPGAEGRGAQRVRSVYTHLLTAVSQLGEKTADDETIPSLLGALTNAVGNPSWALVRMSDRFIVEGLRRRALDFDGNPRDAARLVSDASASLALLSRINLRPALIAEDLRCAQAAMALIEPARHSDEARETLVQTLDCLHGRSEALDALAQSFARGSSVGWRLKAALEEVVTQLETPSHGGFF